MFRMTTIAAGIATALIFTGCATATSDTATPEAPTAVTEAQAQEAAASLDPVFADPEVWHAATSTAQTLCDLADVNPDTAFRDSLIVAAESGVSPEQVGIIWGIAVNVYCPEHANIAG